MNSEDYRNPKKRMMILLGSITINTDFFENKHEVEKHFPFVFHDALYGRDISRISREETATLGSDELVNRAFSSLIGQIIRLPQWDGTYERIKIEEVYINYWCQICAHGELVEEDVSKTVSQTEQTSI